MAASAARTGTVRAGTDDDGAGPGGGAPFASASKLSVTISDDAPAAAPAATVPAPAPTDGDGEAFGVGSFVVRNEIGAAPARGAPSGDLPNPQAPCCPRLAARLAEERTDSRSR